MLSYLYLHTDQNKNKYEIMYKYNTFIFEDVDGPVVATVDSEGIYLRISVEMESASSSLSFYKMKSHKTD